jgi:hypothetical protein
LCKLLAISTCHGSGEGGEGGNLGTHHSQGRFSVKNGSRDYCTGLICRSVCSFFPCFRQIIRPVKIRPVIKPHELSLWWTKAGQRHPEGQSLLGRPLRWARFRSTTVALHIGTLICLNKPGQSEFGRAAAVRWVQGSHAATGGLAAKAL